MKKIGIIRCLQNEDMCPSTLDFEMAASGGGAFVVTGPAQVSGFVTCGGCPGNRAVPRAKMLVEQGAEAVFLSSSIGKGEPIGMSCPHFKTMRAVIADQLGDTPLIDWTY